MLRLPGAQEVRTAQVHKKSGRCIDTDRHQEMLWNCNFSSGSVEGCYDYNIRTGESLWPPGTKLVLVADQSVLVEQRSCRTASRAARCSEEVSGWTFKSSSLLQAAQLFSSAGLIRNTAVLPEVLHCSVVLRLGHDGGLLGKT